MNKTLVLTFPLVLLFTFSNAQQKQIDSINALIKTDKVDTVKAYHLYSLAKLYDHYSPTKAIELAQQIYVIAQASKNYRLTTRSLNLMANNFTSVGDYSKAMQLYLTNLKLMEEHNDTYGIIQAYNNIGSAYNSKADYQKALQYLIPGLKKLTDYYSIHKNPERNYLTIAVYLYENMGVAYLNLGKKDLAEKYFQLDMEYANKAGLHEFTNVYYNDIGLVQIARGHLDSALVNFKKAISIGTSINDAEDLNITYINTAKIFIKLNKQDSAIVYAKKGLESAQSGHFLQDILNISKILYSLYDQKNDIPEAYKYYKIATATNDSIFSQEKVRQLVSIDFEERQRQQEIATAKTEYQNTIRTYILIGVIAVALFIAIIFWRNSRQRQIANDLLQEQKEEIEATLEQLQQTQTQLIQSEKMASLGELTAGIAHEIQNPLNFVNNFSEVSVELLAELKEEARAGRTQDVIAIADDLTGNLEKIRHHGKRADAIVKGMLEHSRASTGQKQATDINKLADEYLRLAYHGLRAKDKSFNADLVTNFDEKLPSANVIPQDIGRVLLNIFNNAFYAVNQKTKTAGTDYKPAVEVITEQQNGSILIKVKDNGNGIPDVIKDKIMQPFFTTKPTGEGTGLGLSLSYDIVVKGHGGSIEVNSKEGVGSEFTIKLPIA
ncbi:MAG: GHKL domain-containing protein [Bacteroidetes bacterium]|jgi:signal transduction histidine kinase|nr:GHKL domain-containing protein [Bacteroidota bacterium]